MVSWVPGIVVPTLAALAFFRTLPRRWVLGLAPLAWVQDLDILSPGAHRVYSHNLWVALVPLVACWMLWRRRDPTAPFLAFAARPGWPVALLLASYYFAAHTFLDVFAGGVLLFWPLSQTNFFLFYEIYIDLQTGEAEAVGEAGTSEGAPELSTDYPWLTFEHTATLAFFAVLAAAMLVAFLLRRRRSRTRQAAGEAPASAPAASEAAVVHAGPGEPPR